MYLSIQQDICDIYDQNNMTIHILILGLHVINYKIKHFFIYIHFRILLRSEN